MATKTAILYARVSTPGQAERGYSLEQQMEALRRHAEENDRRVIEEVRDAGYSGATLERPGMDHIMELVAGGGVDLVLAQDADRITREPWHYGYLKATFEQYGTRLRALDERDDDTPEGEFFADIQRGMKKMEREYTKRRTRQGKRRKAQEGKVLGSGPPPYGFRFTKDDNGVRVGLAVDEATIPVVQRLFKLVGDRRMPMYAAGRKLESEGHMAPKGGPWRVSVIRNILRRDCYRPHTLDELRDLGVAGDVLSTLDPEDVYGVHYFGKRRVQGPARGSRTYRRVPREQWIPVPVPNAGIPPALFEAAQESIGHNPRPAFGGGGRDHELAGGVLSCGECGRAMTTYNSGSRDRKFWYYGCPAARTRGAGSLRERCTHRRMHRAEVLEREIVVLVDGELLTDPERLAAHLDAAIERERATLGNPSATIEVWHNALAEADREMDALVRLYTTGRLRGGDSEYDRRAAEVDARRNAAEGEIARLSGASSRVEEMEAARRAVLEMWGTGLSLGVHGMPSRLRRQVYGLIGLGVTLDAENTLTLEGRFDADLMRLTPEIEAWVAGLREIDERTRDASLDAIERELATLRSRMALRAGEATLG